MRQDGLVTSAPGLPRRLAGGIPGSALLAAIMIGSGIAAQQLSPSGTGLELPENAAATATGLLRVIFALARTGRAATAPAAAGACIGAAYWFTSPASFANLTARRVFSDAFAGIAPSSAPVFIAQADGGIAGVIDIRFLYPALNPAQPASVVIPREAGNGLAAPDGARRDPPGPPGNK